MKPRLVENRVALLASWRTPWGVADVAVLPLPDALTPPEGELARLVRDFQQAHDDGDREATAQALDTLCRVVAPEVARFCAFLAGPRVNPLDAAQETLLEICRRLPSLREAGAIRPWVYSIARHKVLAQRRWSWVRRWVPGVSLDETVDRRAGPHHEARLHHRAALVEQVLERLPEEHRTALVLHLMQGMSDSEVAACLGRKKTCAKSLIRRAKESFRKQARALGCAHELAEVIDETDEEEGP